MTRGSKGGWQGGDGPWGRPQGSPTPPPEKPSNNDGFEEMLRKGQERLRGYFGGDDRKSIALFILAAIVLWFSSGIYIVQTGEQGVVLRFGKFHRIAMPGANYHLPYPIETVETPNVETINRILVGVGTDLRGRNTSMQSESLMLTADENIIDMNFEVQWKISNAQYYLFNIRNPEETVKAAAESAMRESVGRTNMAGELSQMREGLMTETKKQMQEMLNSYKAGIEVVSVNIKELTPPSEVIDAFYDVQRAKADQEKLRNEAEGYANDILPRARGRAEQMLQEAEAYKQEVVARAKGDASRFSSIYAEYVQAKDVTKKRMYLDMMEQVLTGMDKTIIDKTGTGVVPVLPLMDTRATAVTTPSMPPINEGSK